MVFVDGSAHFISSETLPEVLKALVTRNSGEQIEKENGVWKKKGEIKHQSTDKSASAELSQDQSISLTFTEEEEARRRKMLRSLYENNPDIPKHVAEATVEERPTKGTAEEIDKLNATARIAGEIQRDCKIKSDPYYRSVEDVAQIELNVSEPKFDHQSLAAKVTMLRSVQSFNGTLHLIFRGPLAEAGSSPKVVTYDAKTGKQLEP